MVSNADATVRRQQVRESKKTEMKCGGKEICRIWGADEVLQQTSNTLASNGRRLCEVYRYWWKGLGTSSMKSLHRFEINVPVTVTSAYK